ncbi:MAG: elongation factor P [Saprospiraceae bacterium]|jgi:elongation factor P
MANTSEIRNGLCIEYSNDIYTVIEFLHVKPGKGPAFVRTKLKSLTSGKVVDNTFPASHKIQIVRVERRTFQFLYKDDMGFNFMNTETFDQISLDEKLLTNPQFIKEGMLLDIIYDADKDLPLTTEMPQYLIVQITYTEPGLRGDTATNVSKPATIETGAEIRVPIFINEGDKVRIDSRTGAYMERIKE